MELEKPHLILLSLAMKGKLLIKSHERCNPVKIYLIDIDRVVSNLEKHNPVHSNVLEKGR